MLCGPRRTPHLLHPGDLRVQGLHRGPEVQPVPVAAHRGGGTRGRGRRSPHPHAPDAQGRRGGRHRARQSVRRGQRCADRRAGRRRTRRPDPARLAVPAPPVAAVRDRPRHLLDHPARRPRPGPRDHGLPHRRRHARPARGRQLRRRRLRAVRGRGAQLYRGTGERQAGHTRHPARRRRHRTAAPRRGRRVGALARLARPRPDPHRAHRDHRLARRPPAGSGDRPRQPAADPRPGPQPAPPGTAGPGRSASALVERSGATVRLAGCCTPVPPDDVTGFTVRGGAVTVHRLACPAVARMEAVGRVPVAVSWGDASECRVTLVAESFGRPRLLADLTEAIAGADAAIISATVEPPSEQRVRHTYTLQLPDAAGLSALMRAMRDVPGVYDVSRAQHPAAVL
ncbi:ACT domain-containing protein [Streptomyces laculatispora]|uniref:ACT domain-containing protein n=1 Tax=Streptomyces laculatispora TaxID=887464 RepID=UPI003517BE6C